MNQPLTNASYADLDQLEALLLDYFAPTALEQTRNGDGYIVRPAKSGSHCYRAICAEKEGYFRLYALDAAQAEPGASEKLLSGTVRLTVFRAVLNSERSLGNISQQ